MFLRETQGFSGAAGSHRDDAVALP